MKMSDVQAIQPTDDEEISDEEEGSPNVILGSLGLIGIHKPGLKAVFIGNNAIRCAENAVFFEGVSRLFCPYLECQIPFFKHFEKCAGKKAIKMTLDVLPDFLQKEINFVLVEIINPLEVITHYLAFLKLSQASNDWPFFSIYRSPFENDKVLNYFRIYAKKSGNSDAVELYAKDLFDITQQYVLKNMTTFPTGGALVTTLEYESVFCSLKQYKWVLNTCTMALEKINSR
jgi:hypothetical protein